MIGSDITAEDIVIGQSTRMELASDMLVYVGPISIVYRTVHNVRTVRTVRAR